MGENNAEVLQRWRTITVDAIFLSNEGIEATPTEKILSSLSNFDNTLEFAYPDLQWRSVSFFLSSDGKQHLAAVFKRAR